jgi:amino acid adenylation domain-containing protein
MTALHAGLIASARAYSERTAVIDGGSRLTYAALDRLSDRLRDRLVAMGVGRGDRVGIYVRKSADSLISVFGILKSGAVYVPVDPTAPPSRNAYIHNNCRVSAVIVETAFAAAYHEEFQKLGASLPPMIELDGSGGGAPMAAALDGLDAGSAARPAESVESGSDELAYILYTSGSTGRPKGVMLTHGNAVSFVNWCSQVFEPNEKDVFSSHAPFHFDLSILDIYLPLKHGAAVVLIGESISKEPTALCQLIQSQKITVWYSAPSILSLIAQFGKISEHDLSSLRIVLFAGEVFPIVHLRSLTWQVPWPRYFNLYGPTETNVCTYYEIPRVVPEDRTHPYPIGKVCENLRATVVDADGVSVVPAGAEGELCIAGPNVMTGYWGLDEQTANSFLDGRIGERAWYKTGDIVVQEPNGDYRYVGRRDRMVKKRGYRVELGEIEAGLYRHDGVREAAVIALPDESAGVKIKAHLATRDGNKLSLIELKTFCSRHLPLYMIPDAFVFHSTLPKTSTDKIDYQALKGFG